MQNGITKHSIEFLVVRQVLAADRKCVQAELPRGFDLGNARIDRYHFTAGVRVGKTLAAHSEGKTGLRSVELRRVADEWGKSFEFVINGSPVFAKGADMIPFDSFPTRVTAENYRKILESARDAHMNMVREWGGGHYESDVFYDIAEVGLADVAVEIEHQRRGAWIDLLRQIGRAHV